MLVVLLRASASSVGYRASVALTSSSSVACDEEEGDYEGVCRCGCSLDPTLWLRLRLRPLIIPRLLTRSHPPNSLPSSTANMHMRGEGRAAESGGGSDGWFVSAFCVCV